MKINKNAKFMVVDANAAMSSLTGNNHIWLLKKNDAFSLEQLSAQYVVIVKDREGMSKAIVPCANTSNDINVSFKVSSRLEMSIESTTMIGSEKFNHVLDSAPISLGTLCQIMIDTGSDKFNKAIEMVIPSIMVLLK